MAKMMVAVIGSEYDSRDGGGPGIPGIRVDTVSVIVMVVDQLCQGRLCAKRWHKILVANESDCDFVTACNNWTETAITVFMLVTLSRIVAL